MEPPAPTIKDPAATLRSNVMMAIGAASACYATLPREEYDAARATQIGEELLALIEAARPQPKAPNLWERLKAWARPGRWVDVCLFHYEGDAYLLQGRTNPTTGARTFTVRKAGGLVANPGHSLTEARLAAAGMFNPEPRPR